MSLQRYKPEQIVRVLRQVEVTVSNGKSTPQACQEGDPLTGILSVEEVAWRAPLHGSPCSSSSII